MKYFDRDKNSSVCAFCEAVKLTDGPENLIVHRGELAYVILNLYPYTSGHTLVVPYQHCSTLDGLSDMQRNEIMALCNQVVKVLREVYKPQGFNIGLNLGSAAGAGIAEHLHMHVVPRWGGDANFISVLGATRVLPENVHDSYARIKTAWDARGDAAYKG